MELEPGLGALMAAVLTWAGLLLSLALITWEEEGSWRAFPAWDPSEVLSHIIRHPLSLAGHFMDLMI